MMEPWLGEYIYIYIYIYCYNDTYAHTYIHTYIHINIQTLFLSLSFSLSLSLSHTHTHTGQGLLIANSERWFRNRRLLTPAFHFDILKPYVHVYNGCTDVLLVSIDQYFHSITLSC